MWLWRWVFLIIVPSGRIHGNRFAGLGSWLVPRPGVVHRRPKTAKCLTSRVTPARPSGRFVPGKDGRGQGRPRTEHRNKARVSGVLILHHGACHRLALLWTTQNPLERTTNNTTTTTTLEEKVASDAIARPAPRAQRVGGGRDGAVVLVARCVAIVWCVMPTGAGVNQTQAGAAVWWCVSWNVGRTKRHELDSELFRGNVERSSSTAVTYKRRFDE